MKPKSGAQIVILCYRYNSFIQIPNRNRITITECIGRCFCVLVKGNSKRGRTVDLMNYIQIKMHAAGIRYASLYGETNEHQDHNNKYEVLVNLSITNFKFTI